MQKLSISAISENMQYGRTQLLIDAMLLGSFLLLPNMLIALSFSDTILNVTILTPWIGVNLVLAMVCYFIRRNVVHPLYGMAMQMHGTLGSLAQETPCVRLTFISVRHIAGDISRLAQIAQEYYVKHRDANLALVQAREVIHHITAQQQAIVHSASREIITQYQSVLAYANYLEERILQQAASPDLRYDFDEVSESSFNLKLIAGALDLLQQRETPRLLQLEVPQLMEQTMLALAPSLDRRAMKLTTVEVDLAVMAYSDPAIVAHVLWMLLLGTIRYAADESTLRLRCLYNRDRARVLISIVVSELSPGRLSEDERVAFLERQVEHLTPHMFAETIRIHANMQLAQMLMAGLDARLSILPLTVHSCEICLNLPAADNLSFL